MGAILVTGGAGFIGSQFVETALNNGDKVLVLDLLTYAGNLANLKQVSAHSSFKFIKGDIADLPLVSNLLNEFRPTAIVNFAAESHVDNSISGPESFINTNILGTFRLLEAARGYWQKLAPEQREAFRFLHVSTDEVFGDLGEAGFFSEATAYNPHSPYSASKAASDHIVRAWKRTYGLPTMITNCSNNYGPRQFPEKLIPVVITKALAEQPLPVYGKGQNIRDWIHVEDHCYGVWLALTNGQPGETFCLGGNSERTNLQVVEEICKILDDLRPRANGAYRDLISFVADRPGHDFRYAIDDSKAKEKLGFTRKYADFESGLRATVEWYINNKEWVTTVMENSK